jgi:hypothetical protein
MSREGNVNAKAAFQLRKAALALVPQLKRFCATGERKEGISLNGCGFISDQNMKRNQYPVPMVWLLERWKERDS